MFEEKIGQEGARWSIFCKTSISCSEGFDLSSDPSPSWSGAHWTVNLGTGVTVGRSGGMAPVSSASQLVFGLLVFSQQGMFLK